MNYYILDVNIDSKVIGVRDGCAQAEVQKSGFKDKGLYEKILKMMGSFESKTDYEPDFDVELQCVKMKKSAKVTDVMLFSPALLNCRLLVSKKGKELFGKCNLSPHKFYPAVVFTQDSSQLEFYLFFCKSLDYSVVNFKDSLIYKGLKPHPTLAEAHPREILSITSLEEYREVSKSSITTIDKYVLNDQFDKSLNMFVLGTKIFVCENLYQDIIEANLTGVALFKAFGEHLWWLPTLETS